MSSNHFTAYLRYAVLLALVCSGLDSQPALAATWTDIQNSINAACVTGGTVPIPAVMPTLGTTLKLKCAGGNVPVTLQGAPTKITCATGATPCIVMGSTNTASRANLALNDLYLFGPGTTVVGSEGIQVLATADWCKGSGIRIENFNKGMHLIGPSTDLLTGCFFRGVETNGVDIAVHLDGQVGDIFFTEFGLSAVHRLILADGPGGSGADASFVHGYFNTTVNPGTAAVSISTSDASMHDLLISNIQDWETACPYLEVGAGARANLDNIAFLGDPWHSGTYPGFRMNGPGLINWIRISNSNLGNCSPGGDLVQVNTTTGYLSLNGNDIAGDVDFVAGGMGTITGNRFVSGGICKGTLTSVRASGNLFGCTDR